MTRLHGKVAIVTGASRGIGAHIVSEFLAQGAQVVSVGRSFANSDQTNSPDAPNHRRVAADVGSESDWAHVFDLAKEAFGEVDVLVNNAGQIAYDPLHELSVEDWNAVIATNQTGTWLGMRSAIPHFKVRGHGAVVNVSSIWGIAAVEGAHAYHASKGAVRMMTKNAAITYAQDNIRINSLIPGFIDTPLTRAQDSEINEYVISQTPMRRAGGPDEIAAGAVFLASDESSFMTGAELVIDGGYLAR